MNQLQMLKIALIAYVNSVKAVWSKLAYPLSIKSKRKGTLKDYRIYGNTVQDGEPSPDNPIEMQSVGELVTEGEHNGKYKIPVTVSAVNNLFDKNNAKFFNAYIRVADNTYRTASDSASVLIECEPNETYTISHSYDNLGIFRACYINSEPPASGSFNIPAYKVVQASTNEKTLTVTTDEGCKYIAVQVTLGAYNDVAETLKIINKGTVIESQNFDLYLDEPLRKIGDYVDSIDFERGVVIRNIGQKILTGGEGWVIFGNNLRHEFQAEMRADGFPSSAINTMSNRLVAHTWNTLWSNTNKTDGNFVVGVAGTQNTTDKVRYIYASPSSSKVTPDEWKAQLSEWYAEGNPFTVLYAKPITEEPITLPKLPQFKGTTVYEVDTTVKASGIEVCYFE